MSENYLKYAKNKIIVSLSRDFLLILLQKTHLQQHRIKSNNRIPIVRRFCPTMFYPSF